MEKQPFESVGYMGGLNVPFNNTYCCYIIRFGYDAVLFMQLVSFRRGDPMESGTNVLICFDRFDKLKKTPRTVAQG